jgi:hypothetical protein
LSCVTLLSTLENLNLADNDIADVRPLGELRILRVLDLSDNCIASIDGLQSLHNLESLNLCRNRLESMESLKYLRALKSLNNLSIEGNSLCSGLSYPVPLFAMLPNVKVLDGVNQEEWFVRSSNTKVDVSELQAEELDVSTDKLSVLTAALETQEKIIASQASSTHMPTAALSCATSFPYLALLTQWRKKVFQCALQSKLKERETNQLRKERETDQMYFKNKLDEKEALLVSWKDRYSATSSKCKMLVAKVAALELTVEDNARLVQIGGGESMERDIGRKDVDSFSFMRDCVVTSKSQIEAAYLVNQIQMLRAFETLRTMEIKLSLMAEHLKLLTVSTAHKEIQLRNSRAAFLAEKAKSRLNSEGEVCTKNRNASSDILTELRPEVESVLRMLFRQLDQDDRGVVSTTMLLRVLKAPELDEDGCAHDETSAFVVDGDSVLSLIAAGLGPSGMQNLVNGLRTLSNIDPDISERVVTWGEFLLLLLPDTAVDLYRRRISEGDTQNRISLSLRDVQELRRLGVFNEEQWGMVPLNLGDVANTEKFDLDVLDRPSLRKEIRRLFQERSFLLRRLQDSERTMERRVEEAKAFFASEIRRFELAELRLNRLLRERTEQSEELQRKAVAQENHNHEMTTRFDSTVRTLREQIEQLSTQLRLKEAELAAESDERLHSEKSKRERLEAENGFLRRDLSKTEIRCKSLQRDVLRSQTTAGEMQEELMSLRAQREEASLQIAAMQLDIVKQRDELFELRKQLESSTIPMHKKDDSCGEAMNSSIPSEAQPITHLLPCNTPHKVPVPEAYSDIPYAASSAGSQPDMGPQSGSGLGFRVTRLTALTEKLLSSNSLQILRPKSMNTSSQLV